MNQIFKIKSFLKFPQIYHGFSQKSFGNLKPQKNKSNFDIIFNKEQADFFVSQNISQFRTVFMEEIHGADVASCDNDCAGHWVPGVDALVTTEKNLFLCVNTADCVPLFFYEPVNKIIGIAHAGWRGTLGQIGNKVIQRIIEKHRGKTENIIVGIGPSICVKCYEVDKERYELFQNICHCNPSNGGRSQLPDSRDDDSWKYYLDLKGINVKILIEAGIKPENIEISPYCTVCDNDLFFSHRKNKKKDYGEMVGMIGMT